MTNENEKQLLEEIKALRIRLVEAEETINAIRGGGVDAIVVSGLKGEQVFTLTGAERAYRVLIETMNEGAASLNREGMIIYCNQRLAGMLKIPLEKVIGAPLRQFVRASDLLVFDKLMEKGLQESGKGEVAMINSDGAAMPVLVSVSELQKDNTNICGITVTDLTVQKRIEEELRRHRDYLEELVKDRTNELEISNRQLLEKVEERMRAEQELMESKALFEAVVENVPHMIFLKEAENLRFVIFNRAGEEFLGYDRKDLLGKNNLDLFPPEQAAHFMAMDREVLDGETGELDIPEEPILTNKKGERLLHTRKVCIRGADGTTKYLLGISEDITEHRKLEAQLRQSQKMEAVGQLAGGVAHDYNNILSAIFGYAELSLRKLTENDPVKKYVEEIMKASERAAVLTKSLLTFSRKQAVDLAVIDLSEVVKNFEIFLHQLVREDIELKVTCHEEEQLAVMADRGQIEQVIMNLVANGRDAMPNGGKVAIETLSITMDEEFVAAQGYGTAGKYAVISVADSGSGMDKETQAHIFEPFYTTKEQGRGTGLGLSMAYGIIKKHDGFLNVYSEPGIGTIFRIYLPLVANVSPADKTMPAAPTPLRVGTETILVCEDDAALRKLAVNILSHFGYRVIEAVDGQDAVEKFVAHQESIDLVFIDAIMPRLNGKEASTQMKLVRPDIKTIFVSGYARSIFDEGMSFDENAIFINKPYSPSDLLARIRELLDKK